jgi:hypothetical protein
MNCLFLELVIFVIKFADMKTRILFFVWMVIAAGWLSCDRSLSVQEERFGYVTLLGKDTLAVEEVVMQPGKVQARVVLRSPRLTFLTYELGLDPNFEMMDFSSSAYAQPGAKDADLLERQTLQFSADRDSLYMIQRTRGEIVGYNFAASSDVLPFLDMIHWPLDVISRKMPDSDTDTLVQPLFAGRRTFNFRFFPGGGDTLFIEHPTRGITWALREDTGALTYLDAGATTRKLRVFRVAELDFEGLAAHFMEQENQGKRIGELSGRGTAEATIGSLHLELDYGQPARRGRELFGQVVPWGERWRTGANKATHLRLDRDVRMGDLLVPAGEYTLFSIPQPDGGVLIVNKQTGQNGQSYDPALDLGRVPMQIANTEESVELFTMDAVAIDNNQGLLRLMWGNTVFSIPFSVQ